MKDYEKEFEAALETPQGAEADVKEGRFVVDNDDKAEWAAKKIAELKREQAKVNALVDDRIAKMEKWRSEQLKPLEDSIRYFESVVRPYAEATIATLKKKKSFTLPNGAKFSITKGKTDIKRPDDDIFKTYLINNKFDEYLETTTTAKWGEFKKACNIVEKETTDETGNTFKVLVVVNPDGEIIEGMQVVQGEDKFKVDVENVEVK